MSKMWSPDRQLVEWAKKSLHGLDDSYAFIGVLNDLKAGSAERVEFLLQLGHCVVTNKPIIITVPHGVVLSPTLERVATRVVRYDPKDLGTLRDAVLQALKEMKAERP